MSNAWSFSGDGELDEGTGGEVWSAHVRNLGAPGAMAAGGGVLVVVGYDGYSGLSAYVSSDAGDAGVP